MQQVSVPWLICSCNNLCMLSYTSVYEEKNSKSSVKEHEIYWNQSSLKWLLYIKFRLPNLISGNIWSGINKIHFQNISGTQYQNVLPLPSELTESYSLPLIFLWIKKYLLTNFLDRSAKKKRQKYIIYSLPFLNNSHWEDWENLLEHQTCVVKSSWAEVMGSCCSHAKDEWSSVGKNRGSTSYYLHFEGKFCPLIFFPRKGLSGNDRGKKVLGMSIPQEKKDYL